ncbi:YfhO family protein [Aurantibacter aestuarii]|uniref:YfhO family protein n=1 Tax=Aurantibacter aestuarii TaxID=1266046 RepID=A0A2T1N855_9FLAO|nr:YfhO family protein [Aurantibacter aestuarii]PSG88054.1 hypothetical protein C7H52_07050 [Aurantibacter aestuarii]
MSLNFKKILPHILIVIGFVLAALLYFSPVLKGKEIYQSDIVHYIGMAQQQKEFKTSSGEETYWTNSAFGGMPTYQLGAKYPHNYIKSLDLTLRFLPRPADYLFLYFIGFYILLLSLKLDFKMAALGALAFGFSTYLIIIIGVGHNSKAHAIAYMPLVLAGIIYTFRRKYILGFLLTTIALGLELVANHFQMTYYLMLLILVLGIVYLIDAYKKKLLPHYFKSVGILCVALVLAIGLNATNFMATQEYVKESTRGKSELTINPDGSKKEITTGLSKEYITEYSYGLLESFNLFIPRFLGGGSGEDVGKDSETYKFYQTLGASPVEAKKEVENTPTYWGDQTIVEAPAYIGAVILFLFVLALFLVKGRLKWWLLAGSILSLLLSYGKNLEFLTNFFIDYVPFYNKFRAVSSIQVILELCIPVLAVFGLHKLITDFGKPEQKQKALVYSLSITGGLCVLFLVFSGSLFDFVGANDGYYRNAYGEYGQAFVDALRADRKTFFVNDTFRTLILILISSAVIFGFLKQKISENILIIAFACLIVFDLVGVDRRYVNNDSFVSSRAMTKPYQANKADLAILKDEESFRVLDVESRLPAKSAYFHNSLNGYHAAKLSRFDDVYSFYISKNNPNILNLFNVKYVIASDEEQGAYPFVNPDANGNAWFVKRVKTLANANEELLALEQLESKELAVTTDKHLKSENFLVDSTATITLKTVQPNKLEYTSNNKNEGFAVFSEMYYSKGWKATINGKEQPIYRVDYTLRGLKIPAGNHTILFTFEPEVVKTGSTIALISSILVGLLLILGVFFIYRKKNA